MNARGHREGSKPWDRAQAASALVFGQRVARRFMRKHEHWPSYPTDLAMEALLYMGDATGDSQYRAHVEKIWAYREQGGPWTVDYKTLFTCVHYEMYARTGNSRYVEKFVPVAQVYRDVVVRDSRAAAGFFLKPQGMRFVDMIQGYAVFMARAGVLSGNRAYFDECVNQYLLHRDELRNPKTGLWHHAIGAYPEDPTRLSPQGWGRGHGWVLRGLVDALATLPKDYSRRQELRALLWQFAFDTVKYQDEQGYFHQLMHDPTSYAETSATAMFGFYLARAVGLGLLPADPYRKHAQRAVAALHACVDAEGAVSGVCPGTPPLADEDAYRTRVPKPDDEHGWGTVMMASVAGLLYA